MNKTCLILMPFDKSFDPTDQAITQAAVNVGLEPMRADRISKSGLLIEQIVDLIRSADVIVADITGQNANVMFELGIVEQHKNPDQVVILTQSDEDVCSYLQSRKYLKYTPATLAKQLDEEIRRAAQITFDAFVTIHGKKARTRRVIADLRDFPSANCSTTTGQDECTLRIVAGLTSLAIDDKEPRNPDEDSDDEYEQLLLDERNALLALIETGCRLKAVINPPQRFVGKAHPERLAVRYRRLISILEANATNDQMQFVLSPLPHPNTFILGRRVCLEGLKYGINRGFDITLRTTAPKELERQTNEFDRLFDASRSYTLEAGKEVDLNKATVKLLTSMLAAYEASIPTH